MRSLFTLSLISFTSMLFAQVPGYQGKKFNIGYSYSISPCVRNPNNMGMASFPKGGAEANPQLQKFIFSFNGIHRITADHVIGRFTSVNLAALFYNTRVYYDREDLSLPATPLYGYYNFVLIRPRSLYKITGFGGEGGLKLFGTKYIAPFGHYFSVTYSFQHIKADLNGLKLENVNDTSDVYGFTTDSHVYVYSGIFFGLGKQRIINNKFIVDSGVKFAIPVSSGGSLIGGRFTEIDPYMKALTLHRANCLNGLNFYIGISFLGF